MDNGELWNVFKIIASGDTSIFHFQFSIFHYYPASLADKNEFEVWQTLSNKILSHSLGFAGEK